MSLFIRISLRIALEHVRSPVRKRLEFQLHLDVLLWGGRFGLRRLLRDRVRLHIRFSRRRHKCHSARWLHDGQGFPVLLLLELGGLTNAFQRRDTLFEFHVMVLSARVLHKSAHGNPLIRMGFSADWH